MATYKLSKEQIGKSFLYTVTDENNNVLSKKLSKRNYVACVARGDYYFGRLDLIGKGDHGKNLSRVRAILQNPKKAYAEWRVTQYSLEDFTSDFKRRLAELNEIAYL